MLEFYSSGSPVVYSDLCVTYPDQYTEYIVALSILGSGIVIKAYRAMLADPRGHSFWVGEPMHHRLVYSSRYELYPLKPLPQVKTDQGLQVVLMYPGLIWGLSPEQLQMSLYNHLQDIKIPMPTPLEPEFNDCINRLLELGKQYGYLRKCSVFTTLPWAQFYLPNKDKVDAFREEAAAVIAEFLDAESTPETVVEGVEGVADYLNKYIEHIGEKVASRVKHLHEPGDYNDELFDQLVRQLFPQQKDVVAAAAKRLQDHKDVIISGEMGTGKTPIGAAIPFYFYEGNPYRALVTIPGHLLDKWSREVKETIPNATVKLIVNSADEEIEFQKQAEGVDCKAWETFIQEYYRSPRRPEGPEYWIVSNETLRGGYIQRPGYITKKRRVYDPATNKYVYADYAHCPRCGNGLFYTVKIDGEEQVFYMTPADFNTHNSKNHRCMNKTADGKECGEMLWQADNRRKGYRKMAVSELIKRRLPKYFFDFYIADEAHAYKGATAQGLAFGGAISRVRKVVSMTGTFTDGYANGLYYLLWRMSPNQFKELGYFHDEKSRSRFQEEYGFWLKTIKIKSDEYGKTSRSKMSRPRVKALPGYTINTFPEFLLERTVFIKLSDVAPYLPPKKEYVNLVEMDDDMMHYYQHIATTLKAELKEGGSRVASVMLHTLLSYPDLAEGGETISIQSPDYNFFMDVPQLDRDKFYKKEIELQNMIEAELSQGRRCLVYTTYTNQRDTLRRLEHVVSQVKGAKPIVLRSSTVSTKKREAWVKRQLQKNGINVLICHPKLVETGLDLLECKTIIWVQSGYIPSTVRQASRRSWRIGQDEEIRIVFLGYKNTLQETCLQLIGSKLNASGILEGELTNEGLRNFGGDSDQLDILNVIKNNIQIKNANDIFESYKPEVAKLLKPAVAKIVDFPVISIPVNGPVQQLPLFELDEQILVQKPKTSRNARSRPEQIQQLQLFAM